MKLDCTETLSSIQLQSWRSLNKLGGLASSSDCTRFFQPGILEGTHTIGVRAESFKLYVLNFDGSGLN